MADPHDMDNSAGKCATGGKVGNTTQTCPARWHLGVTVVSKEPKAPIWPTEKFHITAGVTAGAGPTTPASGAGSLAVLMTSATSAAQDLRGNATTTFHLTLDDLPTLWHPVRPKDDTLNPGDDHSAELEIQRDRFVWLQLVWTDPETKERFFPQTFPVKVTFDDNSTQDLKVEKEGHLSFTHPRERTWFALSFPTTGNYIASVLDQTPSATTEFLKAEADLADYVANKASISDKPPAPPAPAAGATPPAPPPSFHFYQLPRAEWTMKQSDWGVTADGGHWDAGNWRFNVSATDDVATKAAPAKLKLDPHWQFVRFEFFDRYYGHSDHGDKRVGLAALTLQGFRSPAATTRGALSNPDTQSNWNVQTTDKDNSCNSLPWILQKKADGSADAQPRAGILLQLVTPAGTFINSEDATTRQLKLSPSATELKPSADRLRLYDLPALWKSPGWFSRTPGAAAPPAAAAGKMVEALSDAELKAPAQASRLIFSLDDMVLTDGSRHQITLAATDRVAVFHNSFADPAEAGNASKVGVYKNDSGAEQSFFSKVDPDQHQYIVDYPNWSRIVIAQGNIFDAFAERVPDEAPNDAVGARAAVRWVDSPPIAAAGTTLPSRPARTDKDFFSIQPYFEQRYNQTNLKYTGPGATQQGIGRFDLATARCCGRDGDAELITNLHYFRLLYDFSAQTTGTLASAGGQKTYKDKNSQNLVARFNGDDAVNTTRTQLLPQDAAKKIRGQVVFFVQPVATAALAHFKIRIISGATARNWMQGLNGTGEFKDVSSVPEGEYATNSYTAAHELGHGGSLPDEYNERWNSESFNEASVAANTPGDAYEDDAVVWDGYSGANVDSALMTGVVQQRNRYYWHSAEAARLATGVAFKVKWSTWSEYKIVPHANAPQRNYVYWPLADAVDASQGARGKFDVLLYTLGRERFSEVSLANGPFDGIIVVVVKLKLMMSGATTVTVQQRLTIIRNEIKTALNGKWYATGPDVQTAPFTRTFIKFSPRFLVDTGSNTANVNAIASRCGTHFVLTVTNLVPPAHGPAPADSATWSGAGQLAVNINFAGPLAGPNLGRLVREKFLEMVGKDPPAPLPPPPAGTPPPAVPPWVYTTDDTKKLVVKVLTGGDAHAY